MHAHAEQADVLDEVAALVDLPQPVRLVGQRGRVVADQAGPVHHRGDHDEERAEHAGAEVHVVADRDRAAAGEQDNARRRRGEALLADPVGDERLQQIVRDQVLEPEPDEDRAEQDAEDQVGRVLGDAHARARVSSAAMCSRVLTIVIAIGVALTAAPRRAAGRPRPRFEPTDLELERPGVLDVDLQLGPVKGQAPWRLVTPDFELDLGVLDRVELDLDGAYAIEGVAPGTPGPTIFDHAAPDNLWLSVKLGVADWHGATTDDAWAIGVQVGPKLPAANDAHGVGVEGLLLVARMKGPAHLVLNLGGLVDPAIGADPRPKGIEAGLDVDVDLVASGRWTAIGELGGIAYLSPDAHQLAATAGLQWSPSPALDVSVVALIGFLSGSDPYGVLVGVSPKVALW